MIPQPWKKATRFAAAGRACCRAHFWNVRPAKRGIAASRWMPTAFSPSARSGLLRSVQLASGATGVPSRPASVGRASTRSRTGIPVRCLSSARACVLISAMCTPWGHTCVQMPQPEQ